MNKMGGLPQMTKDELESEETRRLNLIRGITYQIRELSFIRDYQEQGEIARRGGPKRRPCEIKNPAYKIDSI